MMSRDGSRWTLGVVFIGAGVLHFLFPAAYRGIIPPGYPAPGVLVAVSGVAEILGGLGVLSPWRRTRVAAGIGLALLLVAVYPANVYAAEVWSGWIGWLRLPLQGALVAWALVASGAMPHRPSATNSPGQASRARSSA